VTTTKVRLTFLSVFLTLLTIAFTVALAMRIHSYRAMEAAEPSINDSGDGASALASGGPDAVSAGGGAADSSLPDGLKPAGASPVAAATQTVSREQRYRELLALGNSPQDAAVKAAAETQSAARKAVAPKPPQPQPSAL